MLRALPGNRQVRNEGGSRLIFRCCLRTVVLAECSGAAADGNRWRFPRFCSAPRSARRGCRRFRVAPGGTRQGLMVARSAHSADCTAVLGQGSRRITRFTHFVRCAQTVATSQRTKRAARADPCPAILVAPQIAPGGHRPSRRFFSCVALDACHCRAFAALSPACLRVHATRDQFATARRIAEILPLDASRKPHLNTSPARLRANTAAHLVRPR
jgi:hypothetical protein